MNAPLLPLRPIERLGWMRHFTQLRCKKSCDGFTRNQIYPMRCETVRLSRTAHRATVAGTKEVVTLTGCDLLIYLTAGNGWNHRFLERPTAEHRIVHDFHFLVKHFEIPEVPDVAALQPQMFEIYKARLRALES